MFSWVQQPQQAPVAEQVESARGWAEPRAGVHGTAPPRAPFIQLACRPWCGGSELPQDGEDQKRGGPDSKQDGGCCSSTGQGVKPRAR